MNFDLSEEQQLLAASVRRFAEREYDFAARRRIVDSDAGVSDAAWKALADLGVLALALPADCDGFDGGATDLIAIMEAFGDALLVEPFLATVGLSAQAVARAGTPAQRQRVLRGVAAGTRHLALAHAEPDARYDVGRVAARARRDGDGYVLDGDKSLVLHAACADALVVSARLDGMVALFVVDAGARGLTLRPCRTLDSMRAADVRLDAVRVAADARLQDSASTAADALPAIDATIDFATALVCAEAVGALDSANAATLEYLRTRKQFGVPIGSFQALQHRMVNMMISAEQARSMAQLACTAVDGEGDAARRRRTVSAAKVRIADACRHVAQEAVQLHGGMGMTEELKVSHTFRRLTVIAQQFGDADHHLARFAASPLTAS
jgi:alkylation response protein AidB-like acyl-CoA dehydrogenase